MPSADASAFMGSNGSLKLFPRVGTEVRLVQNAAECPHRYLVFSRDHNDLRDAGNDPRKLHVAPLLADLLETGGFKATLNLAKG